MGDDGHPARDVNKNKAVGFGHIVYIGPWRMSIVDILSLVFH